MDKSEYRAALHDLQIRLVSMQRHLIAGDRKLLVIFEGRDAAGKDGAIKRLVEHASPRETRVVALGKPTQRETESWYFQRYIAHLPGAREWVLFNRSWYNRAGVERVMDFCSEAETEHFYNQVIPFERMLVDDGIILLKYYLDISRAEQEKRLSARVTDPLKAWKTSPIDAVALEKFDAYSQARDTMLERTSHESAHWKVVRADNKYAARINIIRDILRSVPHPDPLHVDHAPDHDVVFGFAPAILENGTLAR